MSGLFPGLRAGLVKPAGVKVSWLLLGGFLLVCLAGCGGAGQEKAGQTATKVIVDSYGREVKVPTKVTRIAATGSSARLLTYAGCADKLVAVTDMDKKNQVEMPYTRINAEKWSRLPSSGAGGSKDVCYPEKLVEVMPEVIFSTMPQATVEELQQKTGIPVVGLCYQGIFDDSIYQALQLVGEVMGTEKRCQEVVQQLQNWAQDLKLRTQAIADKDKPRVYAGAVSFKGGHGIEGSYGQYPPFTAIGANNVVDETGAPAAVMVDREKIVVWDPDILFLNPTNMNLVNEDYKKDPGFYQGLKAVQNKRVYAQLPYNYNSTNIEIAVADAYYAGKVIFPRQFSDVNIEEKAEEIFKRMLGQPYLQELKIAKLEFEPLTIGVGL